MPFVGENGKYFLPLDAVACWIDYTARCESVPPNTDMDRSNCRLTAWGAAEPETNGMIGNSGGNMVVGG